MTKHQPTASFGKMAADNNRRLQQTSAWYLHCLIFAMIVIQINASAVLHHLPDSSSESNSNSHELNSFRSLHFRRRKFSMRAHFLSGPCSTVANSYGFFETGSKSACRCRSGYSWSATNKNCEINCATIANSNGNPSANGQCNCKPNYTFAKSPAPQCVLNCQAIPHSFGTLHSNRQCACKPGYTWIVASTSCELNCSSVKNTAAPFSAGTGCNCRAGFYWNAATNNCEMQCAGLAHVDPAKPNLNALRCRCLRPTTWVEASHSCVVHCSLVQHSNQKGLSTSNSCTCAGGFNWDSSSLSCKKQ